ncbi:translocation/assembly module TamB domain-containing protein [Sulfurovum sp. CS9]|uniref:translocation/assembly module TamB domain-containing protein n=1 Tax=Sulfurovum sp. CS9 TaxID=3391146 RepID=UPI0039ED6CE5
MKKLFYSLLIFFLVLIAAIVFAANSSWVIKKAADKFAPDYKISYDDITGNVFTGVKISELKFDGKTLTKNIKFSWNPSKILYKRIAINEISVEALDVDVVKALIASFPSDDNSTSEPFPLVVLVDKVHVSVDPFEEQGILISKTLLDVEDVMYANDEIGIDYLMLKADTNITNVVLEASLDDGKLEINKLLVEDVDTVSLETMFLVKEANSTKEERSKTTQNDKKEPLNPLIPTEVNLDELVVSVKPRVYKSANIEQVKIEINDLNANIGKIMSNNENSIAVSNFALLFDSNISLIDISGNLKDETLTFENINLKEINTIALQHLFVPETNASAVENVDENRTVIADDKKAEKNQEVNNLIPKYVVIKALNTQIVPATYDPVNIVDLLLRAKDVKFNIQKLVVENGYVDLNGTTNLSNITYRGKIKDNQIVGGVVLSPNEELFTLYKLPIRKEAIGNITIDIDASKEHVIADLKAKAKQILIVEKSDDNNSDTNASKAFNVDIDSLLSHVVYTIADNTMVADTKIMITTPYAKDISVTNKFLMDKNMSYSGDIKAEKLIGIDAKLVKPLNNFNVKYSGDLKSVKTDISSDSLKGSFVSSDFKKGNFHIETTKAIEVDKMVALPGELNGTKVNAVIDVPLDFAKITPIQAKAKITSNISNIEADITYGETLQAKITSNIPADSLLKNFDKNVKWNAISPLVINVDLGKKDATLKLKSKELSSDIKYVLDSGKVDGTIKLAGLVTDVKGIADENITIKAKVNSIESLMSSVKSFYTLEGLPPVEGALNLSVDVMKLKQANLSLSSPKIIYHADRKTEHVINDVKLVVSADKSKVQLKSYAVTYDEMKIFSTKPSLVKMKKENIEISELWLNDQLKVVGTYNLKTAKGDISADASTLHIAHKMIELDSAINIKTLLNEGKTSVKGKVVLLGGQIHYDLGTKTYPSDSDIIIVQDMKKEEASPFMDNLSVLIDVTTKKPLIYKQGPIDIQAKVDLDIHKAEYSELMVLGEVVIVKGGSYTFEGKKFVLDKSNIYFTGNPNKPLLDMSIKYKSLNHLITIAVSGTPATPNITFSSIPSLSREQILSIILFDSEEGAGTNSGEDMMKMMGGAMAKSALSDMGIKLDHLAIGSDGSVEVGKKLTDKITFIYVNDEIPQVRVKYQHSPRWESVISADEESESYDIVYKKDFSEDDIILFGK